MQPTDPLSQHLALLRIRRRAARRYGFFFAALLLMSLVMFALYLRITLEADLNVLIFPLISGNFAMLTLMHGSKESDLSSVIDLIEILQQSG